jgi:hypothetical protein
MMTLGVILPVSVAMSPKVSTYKETHDIKIGNRWFENVAQFRNFGNDDNKSKPDSGGL